MTTKETAILAGGCFWCLEAVYLQVRGVLAVKSGYIGGHASNPSYDAVCSGRTGHAEAVRIEFDPAQVSYEDLLEIFFVIHDPTQKDRQGNDVGTQYRSAIFCTTPAQQEVASAKLAEVSKLFPAKVVTELHAAPTFYPAEDYHHDYFSRNPNQPYCAFVVAPKVAKFREKFASLRQG